MLLPPHDYRCAGRRGQPLTVLDAIRGLTAKTLFLVVFCGHGARKTSLLFTCCAYVTFDLQQLLISSLPRLRDYQKWKLREILHGIPVLASV